MTKIIKNYSCLWDKKSKIHRNLRKREEAWTNIAEEMQVTGKYLPTISKI